MIKMGEIPLDRVVGWSYYTRTLAALCRNFPYNIHLESISQNLNRTYVTT